MSAPKPLTVDDVVEALSDARGCGCCGSTEALIALVGCSPACEVDEDGDVYHTYGEGCAAYFREGARRLVARLVEEALR